ncbi:MAG: YczE/YyaS/YitT family protein [Candidatus Nanopelagicaceae bacterium]|jgi:uncharacterized membrane protein YczE
MSNFRDFLRPARTVPTTKWTARHLWDLSFTGVLILFIGLTILGLGGALVVRANLGNAPWTVFAEGISIQSGLSIGTAFFLSSCLVLLLWIPLAIKPGFGTIANATYFAIVLDWALGWMNSPSSQVLEYLMLIAGIACVGLGSAIYMTCGLGGGPRDGLLMGLIKRTGVRIIYIKMTMDGTALLVGFLLGGTVGVGTVLSVVLYSWSVALSMTLVAQLGVNK